MKFKSIISLLAILLISQCKSLIIKPLDFSKHDLELFDAIKNPVTHRPLVLEDDEDDKKESEYEINTLQPIFDFDDEFGGQPTTKDVQEDVDKATESSTMLKSDNISKDFNNLVDENKLNPSGVLVDNENQPASTFTNLPVPLPLFSPTPFVAPVDDEIETSPKVTPDDKSEPRLPVTSVDDKKTSTPSIVPVDDEKSTSIEVSPVDDRKEPQPSVTSTDDASKSKSSVISVDDKKKSNPSIVPVDDDKEVSSNFTPVDDLTKFKPSVISTDNENKPIPSTTPVDDRNKSKTPVLLKNNVSESESPTISKNDVTTQSPDAPIDNKKPRSHRVAVFTNEDEMKYINLLSDKFNIDLVDILKSDSAKPKNNDDNEPKLISLDNPDTKPPPVTSDNKDRKSGSEIPPYAKYNVDLLNHNEHGPFQPIPPFVSAFPLIPPAFSRIPAIPQIPDMFIPQIPSLYIPRPSAFQFPQFPPHFPFVRNSPALNHRTGPFNNDFYYHHPTQQVPIFNHHPYHHYPTQQVQNSNNYPYHSYQNQGIKNFNNHPYRHYLTQETRNFHNYHSQSYRNNKMQNSNYNPNHLHLQY